MFDPTTLSTRDLETEIGTVAGNVHAGTARLLALLGEFDARTGWEGFRSCGHWLSWRTGLSRPAARDHVRVARALRSLPKIAASFARGELSFSKVRAITRIAVPETELALLHWGRHGTASQLERLVRGYRGVVVAEDPQTVHRNRELSYSFEDGFVTIRARLTPDQGEVVLRAIDAAKQTASAAASQDPASAEAGSDATTQDEVPFGEGHRIPESSHPTLQAGADALVRMAESFLRGGGALAGDDGDDAPVLVVVHTDEDTIGRCETSHGAPVPHETLRRLACDAGIVRLHPDGTIGRRTRVVPRWMRRAVKRRDKHCRFPGCEMRVTQVHHIVFWSRGGPTSTRNLVLVCAMHHHLIHEGGYSLRAEPDGSLVFRRPDGALISYVPEVSGLYRRDETVSADAAGQDSYTARPDYGIAVGHLLDARAEPTDAAAEPEKVYAVA